MDADNTWALYLRLQTMALNAPENDYGWALDEALNFVIEEIAAGRRASERKIKNILTNRAAKYRRRRRLITRMRWPDCTKPSVEARLEMNDQLRHCTPRDQQILMALAEGFTVEEVATEHKVPKGTIKSWAHRARRKIAEQSQNPLH